jgi:hypothetical protein
VFAAAFFCAHKHTQDLPLFIHKSTDCRPLSIFFMKYVAVTPQNEKEKSELKKTGPNSTFDQPTNAQRAPLTFLIVLCSVSVVCFSGKLSVVLVGFGMFYRFIHLCLCVQVFRLIFLAL